MNNFVFISNMVEVFATRIYKLLVHEKKYIGIVLVSIIFWLAALGYSIYKGDYLPYPDERWYFNDYAQNLVKFHIFSMDGINSTAFNPPGYPFFLAVFVRLGFGIITARLMNFLAMFLTLLCVFSLLDDQTHKLAAILAVFLALGYPVLFYTAGTLYPQTLGAFFFILATLLYWKEPFTTKKAVFSGVALGIAILTIPTFLFVPFFFVFFSIFIRKDTLTKTALLFIVVFVTIAPWTLRNYLVFHRFKPISTNFGLNFLLGNSSATTPNNGTIALIGISNILEEADRLGLDEFERDEFYTKHALAFIQQNPKHYITLYFLKVANYFNFRNDLQTDSESSLTKDLLMLFTYGVFLLITVLRVLLFHKYPFSKLEVFLILLYFGNAFISALAFTRIRFRLPFDYLLIILVAMFLEKLFIEKTQANIKVTTLVVLT